MPLEWHLQWLTKTFHLGNSGTCQRRCWMWEGLNRVVCSPVHGQWKCRGRSAWSREEANKCCCWGPHAYHQHVCVPRTPHQGSEPRSAATRVPPALRSQPPPSAAAALTWSRWWARPWALGKGTGWWRFCSRSKPPCKARSRIIKKKKGEKKEKEGGGCSGRECTETGPRGSAPWRGTLTCRRPVAPPGRSRRAPAPGAAAAGAGPGCRPAAPSGRLSPARRAGSARPGRRRGCADPPLLPPRRRAAPRRRQMCPRGGAAPAQMCRQMQPRGGTGRSPRCDGVAADVR